MIVMMVIFINLLLEKEMPIETVRDVDHSITTNKQDESLWGKILSVLEGIFTFRNELFTEF